MPRKAQRQKKAAMKVITCIQCTEPRSAAVCYCNRHMTRLLISKASEMVAELLEEDYGKKYYFTISLRLNYL